MGTKYFTREGYRRYMNGIATLQERLDNLSAKNAHALEQGNQWHDNFAWEQLQREIRDADHHLKEVRKPLASVSVIEYPRDVDRVMLGAEVDIERDGTKFTYQIVAYGEDDPAQNKILYETPLAQAIMLKKKGETIEVRVADQNTVILILDVRPINSTMDQL